MNPPPMFKTLPSSPNPNPNPNPSSSFNSSSPMTPHSSFSSISSSYSIPSPSLPPPTTPHTIHHVSFNQDVTHFVIATDRGFFVYDCQTLKQGFRREQHSGFSIVHMLFQSNLFACVGSVTTTERGFSSNKLMMWDDHTSRYQGELSFRSEVRAVRLRNDRVVVVLMQKIYVYRYHDFKLLHMIETYPNEKGLCEVSYASGNNMVLVCLGLRKGEVRIEHYGLRKTKYIVPHNSRIACLALTNDGRLLATASIQGTLVRVYNTLDGLLLQEVRRGAFIADIYSLAFSSTAQWLAVSSDKGTVHVFSLKVDSGSAAIERSNSTKSSSITSAVSSLSFVKGILPKYFSSEWSVAQFRLPERSQYIVGFGHQKNTVLIVGMDGSFYRCQFDPDSGGEMKQLEFHNVLKVQEQESV